MITTAFVIKKVIDGLIDSPKMLSDIHFNEPDLRTRNPLIFAYLPIASIKQVSRIITSACRTFNVAKGKFQEVVVQQTFQLSPNYTLALLVV